MSITSAPRNYATTETFRGLAVLAGLGTAGYLIAISAVEIEPLLLGLVLFCVATEFLSIRLPGIGMVTASLLPVLLALSLLGPAQAILTITMGSLVGDGLLRRRRALRLLFGASKGVLSASAGAMAYTILGLLTYFPSPFSLLGGLSAAALGYTVVDILITRLATNPSPALAATEDESLAHADAITNLLLVPLALAVVHIYGLVGFAASFFGLVALLAVIALMRAYVNIDASHRDIVSLYEASQGLSATLDYEGVLRQLVSRLCRIVSADFGVALAISKEDDRTSLTPIDDSHNLGAYLLQHRGQFGLIRMAQAGEPQAIFGLKSAEDGRSGAKAGHVLLLPLVDIEGPQALIALARRGRRFSPEEVKLASILNSHAVSSLRNARLYQQIERLSQTDGLTGLLNFRQFQDLLDAEVRRTQRFEHQLSLVMLDIDFFKNCNDTYGHETGNVVLKELAQLLRNAVREVDSVCRYGGEEFVILLPEAQKDQAAVVAERIRVAVANCRFVKEGGEGFGLTVSLGIATLPGDAATAQGLVKKADEALYRAKLSGRNRVCVVGSDRRLIRQFIH